VLWHGHVLARGDKRSGRRIVAIIYELVSDGIAPLYGIAPLFGRRSTAPSFLERGLGSPSFPYYARRPRNAPGAGACINDVRATLGPYDYPPDGYRSDCNVHDLWIELLATILLQLGDHDVKRQPLAVWPIGGHSIDGVGN
jgi:hypothetical protein